jgi:hypothetical protein
MSIWATRFWKQTIERMVKTAAQAPILAFSLGEGFNAFDMDWQLAGGFALGGAIVSLLTSLASAPVGHPTDPSLV